MRVCFGRSYWGKEVEGREIAIRALCTHDEPRVANNRETILKILLIRRGTHFFKMIMPRSAESVPRHASPESLGRPR